MTNINQSKLSTAAKRLLGGGIGIILVWALVTFLPEKVAPWANAEPGKKILTILQIGLFCFSILALIVVCMLIAQVFKGVKLTKIKYKDIELNFDDK